MSELLPLGAPDFLVLFAGVLVGALVQGTVGFGLNVIAAPVAAIVAPSALPAALIILSLPMTAGSAWRERHAIDGRGVFWTTLGRLPGIALGSVVVARLETDALVSWIGAMVVAAATMSVVASRIPINPASSLVAGAAAGLMGTTSSMGGPPIALLYQRETGPVLRATLGTSFLLGSSLSLAALARTGFVEPRHWTLAAALSPAVALGLVVSRRFHARVDAGWLRRCVVGFACLAGAFVMVRGLL